MSLKAIAKGAATFVPGVQRFTNRASGGSNMPRYCYSVWLRHLVTMKRAGAQNIRVLGELGPGDSLGTGIASRLSGVDQYIGLEVKKYFDVETNLAMFDALVELFRRREPIPGPDEFPGVRPLLDDYDFPSDIIPSNALDAERLALIRRDLTRLDDADSTIRYAAPWDDSNVIMRGVADAVISQAVMEHVGDVPRAYDAIAKWIRPGGYTSHAIDFRCHKTANEWNGHWAYGDLLWRVVVGSRRFLINREPHSVHVESLKRLGFKILQDECYGSDGGLSRHRLARRFRTMSDQDLQTSNCYILAQLTKDGAG
ncbi:MAG TPA: hypothetical protein VGN12_12480 [Pirellulales bacterium]|jgi:SAM-dependent methyltransferase